MEKKLSSETRFFKVGQLKMDFLKSTEGRPFGSTGGRIPEERGGGGGEWKAFLIYSFISITKNASLIFVVPFYIFLDIEGQKKLEKSSKQNQNNSFTNDNF